MGLRAVFAAHLWTPQARQQRERPRQPPRAARRCRVAPGPVTRFFEGGRVSQTLDGVSETLFDST